MRGNVGAACLALLIVMGSAAPAAAEWQLKPFVAVTGGGETTFIDLEKAAGSGKFAFGFGGVLLGDVFGIEAEFGRTPGFFQRGNQNLVVGSNATTLTGNIVVAFPRRLTEYTLRPYFVGGGGLMHVHIDDALGALRVTSDLPAMDIGGGVTGFLTNRIGLSWDVRYFRSIGGQPAAGLSFGPEQLSYWRGYMSVVIRY